MVKKNLIQSRKIHNQTYFCLKGRTSILKLRKTRETAAREKTQKTRKALRGLKHIPGLQAIFITGSVAAGNAKPQDDIDLMIITNPNRLWLTRLLVTIYLDTFNLRRKPETNNHNTKLCTNLFLSTDALRLPAAKHNLYTATELFLAKQVLGQVEVVEKLHSQNQWAADLLPHATLPFSKNKPSKLKPKTNTLLNQLEKISYQYQLKHMQNRRTSEIISTGQAFFHPQDKTNPILKKYHAKLTQYGLPH